MKPWDNIDSLMAFSRENDYVAALVADGDRGCWHLWNYALWRGARP